MEKFIMDALEFGSFMHEVVQKLPFLKRYGTDKSFANKALYYAHCIHISQVDRILDTLSVFQAEIIAKFKKPLSGVTPTIYYSNLMWEYVYLILYYACSAEKKWIEIILPSMWRMQQNASIRGEMTQGVNLVMQYVSVRADLNEKIQLNTLQSETIPDIVQIMRDINTGKIQYTDVDWELQIKSVLKLCSLMPTKFPYVVWLWGFLGEIEDPTIRMDILGKMQNASPKCFADLSERQQFMDDCSCIYQICLEVRAYNLRNDIGVRFKWTDDRKSLNDLAHILSDEIVKPEWMVAIAEEMYRASQGDRKQAMLTLVLRANRNIGHLSMDNIVDFAKNLYIAEGFRRLLLEGKEDSLDVPTIDDFNWELRNACFDVYIELRKEQIKEQLNKINRRIKGAGDIECLEKLYEDERSVVDRENGLEQFRGSIAYNAMWYPGRNIIQDMINVFIEYLRLKIEDIKKEAYTTTSPIVVDANVAAERVVESIKQVSKEQAILTDSSTEEPSVLTEEKTSENEIGFCPYINADVLKEKGTYPVEQFQKMLMHACEQDAKVLVAFLIQHEKYGNLDFHGSNKKNIFENLRKYFPTMRQYTYQNFSRAWKDALDTHS